DTPNTPDPTKNWAQQHGSPYFSFPEWWKNHAPTWLGGNPSPAATATIPHYTGSASAHVAETTGFNVAGIRAPGGGFRTYPNAYEGVADLGDLLQRYGSEGHDTLRKIISRWAPPSENNTNLLIQRASQWTGFSPDQQLNLKDPETLRKVMIAMNRNEFGTKMTMNQQALDQYIKNTKDSGGATAADVASGFAGETQSNPNLRAFIERTSHLDPEDAAWCAAFANAVLAKKGIKGTGSNIATSFARWGDAVSANNAKRGDILVIPRGRRPGEVGGHVGFATGERGPHGELGMISGNHNHKVDFSWVNPQEVVVRRPDATDFMNTTANSSFGDPQLVNQSNVTNNSPSTTNNSSTQVTVSGINVNTNSDNPYKAGSAIANEIKRAMLVDQMNTGLH
ncbi:MAG TPA: hypothetical protein V6C65_31870, partial [Allocoleopsis sp.]